MGKSNKDIVLEMIEVTYNAQQYERDVDYYSAGCVFHGALYVGVGFFPDDSETGKFLVKVVTPGGPADGKLRAGDQIIAAKDEHVSLTTFEQLRDYRIGPGTPGTPVIFQVMRDGQPLEVVILRGLIPGYEIIFDEVKEVNRAWLKNSWPDLKVEVEQALECGDLVAVYSISSGLSADFNRFATWPCCDIYRLMDGKIVDYWSVAGDYMQMMQLGYTFNLPPK